MLQVILDFAIPISKKVFKQIYMFQKLFLHTCFLCYAQPSFHRERISVYIGQVNWQGDEMDLDQVPSLWRNKPVAFEYSEPGELVKIHLNALAGMKGQEDGS